MDTLWIVYGYSVDNLWILYGFSTDDSTDDSMENLWIILRMTLHDAQTAPYLMDTACQTYNACRVYFYRPVLNCSPDEPLHPRHPRIPPGAYIGAWPRANQCADQEGSLAYYRDLIEHISSWCVWCRRPFFCAWGSIMQRHSNVPAKIFIRK